MGPEWAQRAYEGARADATRRREAERAYQEAQAKAETAHAQHEAQRREAERVRAEWEAWRRLAEEMLKAVQPRVQALAVLGLPADADPAAIKSAWRRAARQYHPDAGGDRARFEAARAAYEELAR